MKNPRHIWAAILLACAGQVPVAAWAESPDAGWIQADQPRWGLRSGLQFAIHPAGFGGRNGGPRGLIRVGAPVLPDGGHTLVNFIAIEPVVEGKRGFSELEDSQLDQAKGKRFSAGAARTSWPAPGVEQLDVPVDVETFANGARVRLVVSQRTDVPDEIRLTVHTQPGSAPVETCILTATMGNMVRARRLWLQDEVLSSLKLHPDFRGNGFAPHTVRRLPRLARTSAGDVIVAVTGDEKDPASVFPFPPSQAWHYGGVPATQFWKVDKDFVPDDLCVAVNARFAYWQSHRPIPGGVAFENFELRTRFRQGQSFVFGVTRATPAELGIGHHATENRASDQSPLSGPRD
jgi:hypothetical protein